MSLKRGDKIKSKGNGYTLVIPAYGNPQLQKFYQEAKIFAGDTKGEKRIGKILKFVYDNIVYDNNWNSGEKEVSLIRSLYLRKGVCKEKAAILSMILRMEGFDNEYKRGTLTADNEKDRHAWLKVKLNNENFLADPEQLIFGKYDSVLRFHQYEEDKF